MSSVLRVCLRCGNQIGAMRGARAKFCSGICRDKHKKAIQQGGKEPHLDATQKDVIAFEALPLFEAEAEETAEISISEVAERQRRKAVIQQLRDREEDLRIVEKALAKYKGIGF